MCNSFVTDCWLDMIKIFLVNDHLHLVHTVDNLLFLATYHAIQSILIFLVSSTAVCLRLVSLWLAYGYLLSVGEGSIICKKWVPVSQRIPDFGDHSSSVPEVIGFNFSHGLSSLFVLRSRQMKLSIFP